MFETIKEKLWTVLGPVGSIIEARVTTLIGLLTSAIGFMDWSPLLNLFGAGTAFNQTQVMAIGGIVAIKGLVQEITRRFNDPLLKVQAAVAADPEVKKAKKKIKKTLDKTPEAP